VGRPTARTDEIGHEFGWFVAVGAVGFLVDAGLFLLLHGSYGLTIALARTMSASCSIGTTWTLNRRFTFATRRSTGWSAELGRYAAVQTAGLGVNFGVFVVALALSATMRAVPIAALALGAGTALVFNFASARTLAFRGEAR
jgi:putative flippase GtrA